MYKLLSKKTMGKNYDSMEARSHLNNVEEPYIIHKDSKGGHYNASHSVAKCLKSAPKGQNRAVIKQIEQYFQKNPTCVRVK
jgi:hypothetical protein